MMTGFQAEENLTGRAQKNVRKILDVICQRTPLYARAASEAFVGHGIEPF